MTANLTIFDCDGVLVDSEIIACRVIAEELSNIGFTTTPKEVATRFVGSATKTMLDTLEGEQNIPIPLDIREQLSNRVAAALEAELQPIPGIHAVLADLTGPTCVASNSGLPRIEKSLRTTGLLERFSPNLFSGASHVERPKPAPDIYLHAAREMGVVPAECIVVEDTTTGVGAAVAAGMMVIGFTGGSHSTAGHGDRLSAAGAVRVVETMPDLSPLLPHD